MMGKILLLIVVLALVVSAIMFDWFGARDWVSTTLTVTEQAVDGLAEKGDSIKELMDKTNK
jgi:hypothetical protein